MLLEPGAVWGHRVGLIAGLEPGALVVEACGAGRDGGATLVLVLGCFGVFIPLGVFAGGLCGALGAGFHRLPISPGGDEFFEQGGVALGESASVPGGEEFSREPFLEAVGFPAGFLQKLLVESLEEGVGYEVSSCFIQFPCEVIDGEPHPDSLLGAVEEVCSDVCELPIGHGSDSDEFYAEVV